MRNLLYQVVEYVVTMIEWLMFARDCEMQTLEWIKFHCHFSSHANLDCKRRQSLGEAMVAYIRMSSAYSLTVQCRSCTISLIIIVGLTGSLVVLLKGQKKVCC